MAEIAGWIAPAATMIAAMMTAANLGARLTGWGFVVFTVGSVAWSIVGLSSGQQNLIVANGFLTLVNAVGIWRWLGRQARHEDGGEKAARSSARAHAPTLFSAGALVGAPVKGRDGASLGQVVDAMLRSDGGGLAYLVMAEGGVAGVGERLRGVDPGLLTFAQGEVRSRLTPETLARLPELPADDWPAELPGARPQPDAVTAPATSPR